MLFGRTARISVLYILVTTVNRNAFVWEAGDDTVTDTKPAINPQIATRECTAVGCCACVARSRYRILDPPWLRIQTIMNGHEH
ncbi:hypothetical protein BDN72DRAFT_837234 [Pluteus cervinus]|uniref:Uncharacterized protein n=1 Tax=Pluteus cervinus TaxID=181527 RepID=A0ACD3B0Y3_9AGAR|nr:hypothetical protein BDN72DRAFT_837234 [Pluteus cervinus]